MQYIVTIDNGKDTVPPREEWRTIEARDHRAACFIYCADHVTGWGCFKVLTCEARYFDLYGWDGACVHAFEVWRTEPSTRFDVVSGSEVLMASLPLARARAFRSAWNDTHPGKPKAELKTKQEAR